MIFDDHDMIDDWNISDSWVDEIRQQPWWQDHVIGGLMSYWIYQHLGNLSPAEIRAEGMLAELGRARRRCRVPARVGAGIRGVHAGAGWLPVLVRPPARRRRARRDRRPQRAGARAGEALDRRRRRVGLDRATTATTDARHLLIGTSLPAFVPGGMHDLQRWNERVCDGAWGRLGIRARRAGPAGARPRGLAGVRAIVRRARGAPRRARQRRPTIPAGDDLRAVGRHPLQLPLGPPLPVCHARRQLRPPSGQLADPQRAPALRAQRDACRDLEVGRD